MTSQTGNSRSREAEATGGGAQGHAPLHGADTAGNGDLQSFPKTALQGNLEQIDHFPEVLPLLALSLSVLFQSLQSVLFVSLSALFRRLFTE